MLQETNNQKVVYSDGNEFVVSSCENTSVAICGEKGERDEINFFVIYYNYSDEEINIDPGLIKLIGISESKTYLLKTYTADQYLKKLKRERTMAAIGQALSAASQAYNASLYPSSTSITTGNLGGVPFNATTNTYDRNKQNEINEINKNNLARTVAISSRMIETAKKELLKKNTIQPGNYVAGRVVTSYARYKKYQVTITIGSETHKLDFIPKWQ